MPTDPATVPPLTDAEVRAMIVESFREEGRLSDFDTCATDAEFLSFYSGATKRLRAAYALAASRVDPELKDKRDKVMHMHDLYDALGVEWGRDPFSAIAALKASRVDTAEVERRAARKAWNACAVYASVSIVSRKARDAYLAREHPAPAPRECRKHEGDFFGVPLYSDPNCPTDRVVFEYDGKAVACALIHPDSTALRRNAAEVGQ